MLAKNILYAITLLNENDKFVPFGRTIVQKIMFFSLPHDNRNSYYIPYFYGPYSDSVQLLLRSLENTGYLIYENNEYKMKSNLKIKVTSDLLSKRSKYSIDFLTDNKITSTKEISNLAKVYMILDENKLLLTTSKNNQNLFSTITKKASLVGWKELSILDVTQINTYIYHAKKLEKTFEINNLN